MFNGNSFSVGDKAGDIVSKIGEPESTEEVSVCDPRSTEGAVDSISVSDDAIPY